GCRSGRRRLVPPALHGRKASSRPSPTQDEQGAVMEERVRVCRSCQAMVGWFALFCENCGAKQPVQGSSAAKPATTPAPAKPAAKGEAPRAQAAPQTLEAEVRKHLVAPATDARAVARDLFQTQLGLMNRHRESVEELIAEVESMKKDLARLPGRKDDARKMLDSLSERMFEAEQRWGELQVSYNRDSEAIEEESRESMETADLDAYLSPDEHAKVETEYADLTSRFETV